MRIGDILILSTNLISVSRRYVETKPVYFLTINRIDFIEIEPNTRNNPLVIEIIDKSK